MPSTRVVQFLRVVNVAPPTPANATVRTDVQLSVQRSIGKLPVLGERNPDAALLIERHIDDWMPPPIPGGLERDDPGETRETARRQLRAREAEIIRQARANLAARDTTPPPPPASCDDDESRRLDQHRCVMATLRDMQWDLSCQASSAADRPVLTLAS